MVRSKKRIKFIILGIVVLTLLSLYFLYNPTDYELFPDCPFYTITGAYCPGCGSQRAIHDIIHLNILEAISHNALLVFTLFFGGGFYLYSKSKFYNLIYHPKAPWVILGVIALFWILRNLHIHPFHFLAP